MEFADERFDCVVCTIALCTIPDDRKAISEMWRVLREGGRLLLLEHVRSPLQIVRWIEQLMDPLAVRTRGTTSCATRSITSPRSASRSSGSNA